MGLKELKEEFDNDVKIILSSDFEVTVVDTTFVPTIHTEGITYPNLDTKKIKTKKIETCVLYIDIRKSTELSLSSKAETLTKLYASFMRIMVKAARYYGGHVRNIIGDRIMVVFDYVDSCKNAVHTAFLLNSVAKYILNKHFKNNEVICGIGIDFGEMLVSKGGIVKNGDENSTYKSLVWLGRPANIASKLTDLANKTVEVQVLKKQDYLSVHAGDDDNPQYYEMTYEDFFSKEIKKNPDIELTTAYYGDKFFYSNKEDHTAYFPATRKIKAIETIITPQILITEDVYKIYKRACPEGNSIIDNSWKKQYSKLYQGYVIYGNNRIYTEIQN